MNPFDLLLLTLATWRLSYMLAKEHGPYDLLTTLRGRFALGGLMTCQYCLSVWCALLLYALLYHTALAWVVYALAIAGGAMLLHRHTGGDHV